MRPSRLLAVLPQCGVAREAPDPESETLAARLPTGPVRIAGSRDHAVPPMPRLWLPQLQRGRAPFGGHVPELLRPTLGRQPLRYHPPCHANPPGATRRGDERT